MPKIFEYLGILIFFYSNEHGPIHVHAKKGEFESKAEFYIADGEIIEIKITKIEEYNLQEIQSIKIDAAKFIGDYVIRIHFNDGTEKLVDFKPFLSKSQHSSIKKYFEEKLFSKYQIVEGNLNWNDYDLIFPIWDLYTGKITD
jgi:hypothetical protein